MIRLLLLAVVSLAVAAQVPAATSGYYRQPALCGDTLIFVSEGDLWKVPREGGVATRLTSHPATETRPVISFDGSTVAFVGQYEGPAEIYTMPAGGGLPTRWTYDAARCMTGAFLPDGRLMYMTRRYAGLPNYEALIVDPRDGARERVPLAQAAEAVYSDDGASLFFVRFPFQGSHTRRYQGGAAQDIWRFDAAGGQEAGCLTGDHPGTDRNPMFWEGRVYFLSDRDGTINLWSMAPDGSDKRQHTHHLDWDIRGASLSAGRVAYQLGGAIRLLDLASGRDEEIPIELATDLDQSREKWIVEPWKWLTAAHLSPDGDRVALTARGRVFVAPLGPGRLVEVTRDPGIRYRDARFLPDGSALLALSDESGEVEFWRLPSDGTGDRAQVTRDAVVLRWGGIVSPDGKYLAHHDKNRVLWLTALASGATVRVDQNEVEDLADLTWSPDSRWLAYVAFAENLQRTIRIYDVEKKAMLAATTDRFESYSPAWSADGKRLYFLSDRNLRSLVHDPWGARAPDPYYERTTRIYELALAPGLRSPFQPDDELAEVAKEGPDGGKGAGEKDEDGKPPRVTIQADGLAARLREVPVEPGDYSNLFTTGERLYWLSLPHRRTTKRSLRSAPIASQDVEVITLADSLQAAELSADGKKILVRTDDAVHIIDAGGEAPPELGPKTQVDLASWAFSLDPREEWRQMFVEAWRLERDYFYDPDMHRVDWPAIREKYLPLVDRVNERGELADILSQMIAELSALHMYVYGGDFRSGTDDIQPADLGGVLARDPAAGGYRVERVYLSDPDRPELASPLARADVNIHAGDVIVAVNGAPALEPPDLGALLRHQAGRQVLLEVRPEGEEQTRRVVVTPLTPAQSSDRRYHEWEYTRRLMVEKLSGGRIGYVHLRAMGSDDIDQWTREFFPVFNKEGLIVDVRHNNGGNIDSWIIGALMRKPWFWWQPRVGLPTSNMQLAFQGHQAVLCDEGTASDGEAFAEGIRRLGLGKIIGTRTWGGEIWLSSSNVLVDQGIATAAEFGVYGPEGAWLIEGHGVDPDIVVDNLPHETFGGKDAQLEAAVAYLLERIAAEPVAVPQAPPYPDKSGVNK